MVHIRLVTSWDEVPVIMDLPYVARLIGATPEALRARCEKGTFPGYKEGKLWRVEKEAFRAHIDSNSVMRSQAAPDG